VPDLLRPAVIMLLVLAEVTLWQWRTILTTRGRKGLPAGLGVAGSLLQVTALAQVLQDLTSPLTVCGYAAGVGGGILLGVVLSTREQPTASPFSG